MNTGLSDSRQDAARDENKEDSAYGLLTRFCESQGLICRFHHGGTGEAGFALLQLEDRNGWTGAVFEKNSEACWWNIYSNTDLSDEELSAKYLKKALGCRYKNIYRYIGSRDTNPDDSAICFPDSIDELKLELAVRGY